MCMHYIIIGTWWTQLVLITANRSSRPLACMSALCCPATHDCPAWSSIPATASTQNKPVRARTVMWFQTEKKERKKERKGFVYFILFCMVVHVLSLWKQHLNEWLLVPLTEALSCAGLICLLVQMMMCDTWKKGRCCWHIVQAQHLNLLKNLETFFFIPVPEHVFR
jgi:hypothetical protein